MKFCTPHWEELRAAIRERGLEPFVSTSGEEATRKLVAGMGAPKDRGSFDPLLSANIAIVAHVVRAAGQVAASELSASGTCSLCYFRDHCDVCREHSTLWIGQAADDQLAIAKRLGLVGAA